MKQYTSLTASVAILLSLFTTTTFATSVVNKHFYIGGNFGSYQAQFNTTGKLSANSGGNPYQAETNGGDVTASSFTGNALIGFGFKMMPFYIGAEANIGYFNGHGEASNIKGDQTGTNYKVQQSLTHLVGLSVILGKSILLSSDSMLYIRAGWVNGNFKSESLQPEGYTSGYSGTFEEWQSGNLIGAGIRAYITSTLGLTAEYDYLLFSEFKKSSSGNAWSSGGTAEWTYKPRISMFTVGLVYDL